MVFGLGELVNAGHYVAFLVSPSSTQTAEFDVIAAHQPSSLSLLAKPSRLPVDQHDGISGVAYVFDVFRNLVLEPMPVEFQLSGVAGTPHTQTAQTKYGVAWVRMDSGSEAGAAQLEANAGGVSAKR